MNIKEKIIRFLPIFSILSVLFLSISAKTVSATSTIGRAAGYSRDITVDDFLKPILEFFKSLLHVILSPFTALQEVFTSWGNGLYNQVGTWAPIIAIIVIMIVILLTALFLRFKRMML